MAVTKALFMIVSFAGHLPPLWTTGVQQEMDSGLIIWSVSSWA